MAGALRTLSNIRRTPHELLALALLVACSSTESPTTNQGSGGSSAGSAGEQVQGGASVATGGSATNGGSPAADGGTTQMGGASSDAGSAGSQVAGATAAGGGDVGGASAGSGGSAGQSGSAGASGAGPYNPCPPKGAPCAIMPLGDSITYGYGSSNDDGTKNGGGYRVELLTKSVAANVSLTFVGRNMSGPSMVGGVAFPRRNEGYSGYTIDQVAAKVDGAISSNPPHIVLMMVGTNDMHGNVDVANAPTRLGKIIDKVVADAPNALLVVAAAIPANGAQDGLTKTYNAKVPGVVQTRAAAGKHVLFVDMYTPMAPWAKARFNDSEHPNDAGYKIMADTWYGVIGGLLR
jgi:lysophospholipase L1-like esterase